MAEALDCRLFPSLPVLWALSLGGAAASFPNVWVTDLFCRGSEDRILVPRATRSLPQLLTQCCHFSVKVALGGMSMDMPGN